MDEFDGRDFGGEELERSTEDGALEVRFSGQGMRRAPDHDPREAFACPFCETPIHLETRDDAGGLVAACASCETWFTSDEWRYYKQLVA